VTGAKDRTFETFLMNNNTKQLHVVVGATGGTGSALVRTLAGDGARVRAVSRNFPEGLPAGVEFVKGDALDVDSMCEVCQDAHVVYNCVNPPFARWHVLFPQVMDNLIIAAGRAGATLVFADDTWMYGPPTGPITEEHPQQPAGALGVLRAILAANLLDAHRQGKVRAVIGRASELYGPGVESLLGANLFECALAGNRIFWPGSLDSPLNPTYIDDFARGLVTLGTHDESLGHVWHIPTDTPITGREFVQLLVAETGTQSSVTALNRTFVKLLALVWPVARQGAELIYQFDKPYVVDSNKYRRAFGAAPTPYVDGIRQTLLWYRRRMASEETRDDNRWWKVVWRYSRSASSHSKKE
jgi:nucleoside-diphosphate-sugar epimerase